MFLSVYAWRGQRRLQQEAINLQRATSNLAEKQLELLMREEKGKNAARLALALFRDGKTFRFKVTNISDVDASNVELKLLLEDSTENPLIDSEYREKFPVKKLSPGTSVTLIAALHFGSPRAFNAELKWTNPDGNVTVEETYAAL